MEWWDRWCCLEELTSFFMVRVNVNVAVHMTAVTCLSFMALILYLLLHMRGFVHSCTRDVLKVPMLCSQTFVIYLPGITNVVFLNIVSMLLSTLCPSVYKLFRMKGFSCVQSQSYTASISLSAFCQPLSASFKGPNG